MKEGQASLKPSCWIFVSKQSYNVFKSNNEGYQQILQNAFNQDVLKFVVLMMYLTTTESKYPASSREGQNRSWKFCNRELSEYTDSETQDSEVTIHVKSKK